MKCLQLISIDKHRLKQKLFRMIFVVLFCTFLCPANLYSRSDKSVLQKADIHEGLDTSLLLLRDKYKDKVEIIRDYDHSIGKINCFPEQLNQLFTNLLDNAIDAIENKGTITIITSLKKTRR